MSGEVLGKVSAENGFGHLTRNCAYDSETNTNSEDGGRTLQQQTLPEYE